MARGSTTSPRLVAALCAVAALGGVALTSGSARADDRGELVLRPGQTKKVSYPAPAVPGPAAAASSKPSVCATNPTCDTFRIRLPVVDRNALLKMTLTWTGGADNEFACYLYLWDDPEGAASIRSAPCAHNTATLLFSPGKPSYQLIVRNNRGTGEHYDLEVAYRTDIKGSPFEDIGGGTTTTRPRPAPIEPPSTTESPSPTLPPAPPVATTPPVPDAGLAGLDLADLEGDLAAPGLSLPTKAAAKPGPVSGVAVAAGLAAFPAAAGLGVGSALVLRSRRRRRA